MERELCAVDTALERWRAELVTAAEIAASLADADLLARHAELEARLDDAEAQLATLPTSSVELPDVRLEEDNAPAMLAASIAAFGRVVIPRAITAADLPLSGAPSGARPGGTVLLRLELQSARHATQSAEELELSLGAAAAITQIEAALVAPEQVPQQVQATYAFDVSERCVLIAIASPGSAPAGASVCVSSVTVSGQPVAVAGVPLSIPIRRGPQVPLHLPMEQFPEIMSLCLTHEGQFLVTLEDSYVLFFGADAAPLQSFSLTGFEFAVINPFIAVSDGVTPTLFLASRADDEDARLVALDMTPRTVRWTTAAGSLSSCCGVSALPRHGIVVVSDDCGTLFAHRISDGKTLGSLECESSRFVDAFTDTRPRQKGDRRTSAFSSYVEGVAADPSTGAIFRIKHDGTARTTMTRTVTENCYYVVQGTRGPPTPDLPNLMWKRKRATWGTNRSSTRITTTVP